MFAGFEKQTRRVNGVDIAYRMGAAARRYCCFTATRRPI